MKATKECKQLSFKGQDLFIGIDVHKRSWKVTIRTNSMELKTFSMEPEPQQLQTHLRKNYPNGEYHSVYEAGFCGFWIHKQLVELGIKNIVVNAADIPTRHKERDRKSDQIDSRKLARELENKTLEGIYVPDNKALAIRSVSRNYMRVVKELVRIKQRIKSLLDFHGIKTPEKDEIHHWSGRFIKWLRDIEFTEEDLDQSYKMYLDEYERIREERLQIIRQMRKIVEGNKVIKILRTIPGIGFVVSFVLFAEIIDIKRFNNSDNLASYVGVVPSVNGSGEKERVKGLTKRKNKYLRNLLIQSAWVAIKTDPALTMAYSDYLKRMDSKKAIIRIARKLINRVRYVWINEKEYVSGIVE